VQHKLPDAVNIGQRSGSRRSGIQVLQKFKQSRTMPGVAFKGTAKLVGDKTGFGTWGGHTLTFRLKKYY
jgi:hypothetical protein